MVYGRTLQELWNVGRGIISLHLYMLIFHACWVEKISHYDQAKTVEYGDYLEGNFNRINN